MKIVNFFKKNNRYLFLIIFILVFLSHINWFNPNSIIFSGDWKMWFPSEVHSMFPLGLGTWKSYFDFGYDNIQTNFNFFYILWGLIGSYILGVKLTVFIPILLLQVFGTYLFLKKVLKKDKITFGIFIGILFFVFNTSFLYLSFKHGLILFGFSILPLLIYLYLELIEKQTIKASILLSIVFSISCYYEIRITFLSSIILIFFSIFYFKNFIKFIKNYRILIFTIFNILILNLFWILPLLFSNSVSTIESVANRGVFGNKFTNFLYGFTEYKSYWDISGNVKTFHIKPIPIFYFFILLILPILVIYKNKLRKNKNIIIFSIVLVLLGAFLLKQDAIPFKGSYTWMYNNIPIFNLFRESSKFAIISVIGYIILFSIFIDFLYKQNKKVFYIVFLGFLFLILYPAQSLFTGKIGYSFNNRIYHEDYKQLNKILDNDNSYYKSLVLPIKSKLIDFNSKHPLVSYAGSVSNGIFDFLNIKRTNKDSIDQLIKYKGFQEFLKIAGIKYIILPFEDIKNQDFVYYRYGKEKEIKKTVFDNLKDKLKYKKIGKIDLYENKNYLSPIFVCDDKIDLLKNNNCNNVKIINTFEKVGYNVELNFKNNINYIFFSQKNNPGWKIYLTNKESFILDKIESKYKFLNVWKINKEEVIKKINKLYGKELEKEGYPKKYKNGVIDYKYYKLNPDNSISLNLTLYYEPQTKYIYGLIISFAYLILLIMLYLINIILYKKNKSGKK